MFAQPVYHTFQRYRTLQTHKISALPIVILMPHSACNCQCVMCDIWKGNRNLKQLTEKDIESLLTTLRKFGTRQVVMSGGEALLNNNFFRFCELLKNENIRISLLSTGLSIKRNADAIAEWVDDIIVSLDGDEPLHDLIRNIPGAFQKMREGIDQLRLVSPGFAVTGRTVIHKLNFRKWGAIIETAKTLGLDQVSFLPADISSSAFNREKPWDTDRQNDVLPAREELAELQEVIDSLIRNYQQVHCRITGQTSEDL
jgi:MoaA/NifB/PqqE/SkfB family radical SAM enzyme